MTALCDFCATNPAVSGGLCGRCESEQQRLGRLDYPAHAQHSDNPRPDSGKRHEQRVRDTRQHLGELPELYAALDDFWEPGSTPKDPDQRSGKSNPAWRCVVNLDVLDLTDMRLKDGADATRADYWRDAAEGARRQGVVQTLASWCRLVHEERAAEWDENFPADSVELSEEPTIVSECAYLGEYLDWIAEQPWFIEIHDDVRKMRTDIRNACGERDKHVDRFSCPQCGAESYLAAGGFLSCTMSTLHDVSVRDLEGQYRRRPPLPTRDICDEFHVSQEQVWQWKSRNKIKPVKSEGRNHLWLPWDVFCVLNPDIRAAIDMRDAADAAAQAS